MQNTIYIGANLEGVRRYQVFTTRPTELIARLQTAYPLIGQLFVGVENLPLAESDLKKPGTPRYKAFLQSQEKRPIPAQIPAQVKAAPPVVKASVKQ